MRPVHELASAIKSDESARGQRQVFDSFDDLPHHRFGPLVRILEDHGKSANPFDERGNVGLPKLLFEQHQITFPVTELATVSHIIRTEQDADIAMELGFTTLSHTPRPMRDTVGRQIPPQIIAHAFFGINVAIDRFLADPQRCLFLDHPVADLFGGPAVLQAFDYALAKIRMFTQLTISSASIRVISWAAAP